MSITRVYFLQSENYEIPDNAPDDSGRGNEIDLNDLLDGTFLMCGARIRSDDHTEHFFKVLQEYGIKPDVNFLDRLKKLTIFALGGEYSYRSKKRMLRKEPSKIEDASDWFHRVHDDTGHEAIVFEFATVIDSATIASLIRSTKEVHDDVDSSSNEHQILREVFKDPYAISTVRLLQLAQQQQKKKIKKSKIKNCAN